MTCFQPLRWKPCELSRGSARPTALRTLKRAAREMGAVSADVRITVILMSKKCLTFTVFVVVEGGVGEGLVYPVLCVGVSAAGCFALTMAGLWAIRCWFDCQVRIWI